MIPNWAVSDEIRPLAHVENPLRAEWGLGERFVVGYSGNLGRAHEFKTMLDAAQQLVAYRDVVFLFVGGGHRRELLEVETRRRELSNIRFQPYQSRDRVAETLNAVDVHLVSLRPELEGLIVPSKFYGIAAAGRPAIIIGDPDGELGKLVSEHDCGIATAMGDPGAVAQAICNYRQDEHLRIRHGRNARRLFEQRYDKSLAMESWTTLIEGVAKDVPASKRREAPLR